MNSWGIWAGDQYITISQPTWENTTRHRKVPACIHAPWEIRTHYPVFSHPKLRHCHDRLLLSFLFK